MGYIAWGNVGGSRGVCFRFVDRYSDRIRMVSRPLTRAVQGCAVRPDCPTEVSDTPLPAGNLGAAGLRDSRLLQHHAHHVSRPGKVATHALCSPLRIAIANGFEDLGMGR